MTYKQTIDYLFSQLATFHRIGTGAYNANLDKTILLMDYFNHPENNIKSIHIAGTNGKGSVSSMLASIFTEAGYKTALYTSPHLKDFCERIRINGKKIPKTYVTNFVKSHKHLFNKISPSFFEMTTAMAFSYFSEQKVDIAIIETGLGGRLDSTNVLTPMLSIITNISIDHTQLLGNTLEEIAIEKAGIIKNRVSCVIGKKNLSTDKVFNKIAKEHNSPITFAEDIFDLKNTYYKNTNKSEFIFDVYKNNNLYLQNVRCPLAGSYQIENIKCAMTAIDKIRMDNKYFISDINIINGIKNVITNTGISGRWQILNKKPLTICDTAHNTEGIKQVVNQLQQYTCNKLHIVFGMVLDKNIDEIIQLLPIDAEYYFCKPDLPRGLDAEILNQKAKDINLNGKAYNSVKEAYNSAKENAIANNIIFIGGSNFVVSEVL